MENILLLMAAMVCGCCACLFLLPKENKRVKMLAIILWCFSTLLVVIANVLMVTYQVLSRFEYQYVSGHTSQDTALVYKISALWAGQEGSFLLWAWILSIMGFFMLWMKGKGANRSFGIYAAIGFCIILMCFISQPFAKISPIPMDGQGLNAALKDPWMVVHPPLVFVSYSAMAILFSLSATLFKDNNKDMMSKQILTWIRISWFFLGIGILTGSVWAYGALGWGGYWSWDPIENAALVPWLILCGFLHKNEHQKRSVCLIPFSIACFGVFLARSGILKDRSAHAYAAGNRIISLILFCFLIGTVFFFIITKLRKNDKKVKREKLTIYDKRLIQYNMDLYAILILLGTVAPIFLNIDTPTIYFHVISIAFALVYSVLLLLWDFTQLKRRNVFMIAISTLFVIGIIAISRSVKLWWLLLIWICLMPLSLWIVDGFRSKTYRYYLSHAGVVLLIVGAITSSALGNECYIKAKINHNAVVVAGAQIPITKLAEKDILILTLPQTDLLIQCSKITPLSEGGIFIPYKTKPFILLFWIGCFIVVAQPLLTFILDWFYSVFIILKNKKG